MTLETVRLVWPNTFDGADGSSEPTCSVELRRNRLTQPITFQKYWIALRKAKPELNTKLSDEYQQQIFKAVRHAEDPEQPEPQPEALFQLSDEETLYLQTFSLAQNFCRFASVVREVSLNESPTTKWSPDLPADSLTKLFDWFTDDPDRYDFFVGALDKLFSPNGDTAKPVEELTSAEAADPNS